jgi:hypothetical protein
MLPVAVIGLPGILAVNPNERNMMQTIVCDGCGKSELTSVAEKKRSIQQVRLTIMTETRESMANNNERHEADLCGSCRTLLLSSYFRIKEGRILELPAFIEEHSARAMGN